MRKFINRLRRWYAKWLKPVRLPGEAFLEDVGHALAEMDHVLYDVPRPCRADCALAKAQGAKEDVTGCQYSLPYQKHCRQCPHWSEVKYERELHDLVKRREDLK